MEIINKSKLLTNIKIPASLIKNLFNKKLIRLIIKRQLYKHPFFRNPKKLMAYLFANPLGSTFPLFLQIEVNAQCNLSCEYCIHFQMPGTRRGSMTKDTLIKILDRHKYVVGVQLQGQGEPFLHKKYFELAREVKKRNLFIVAITNGTLFNDEIQEKVLQTGFDAIYFSLDFVEREEQEEIRKGMIYDQVILNIQNFIQKRDKGSYSTVVGINGVVFPHTLNILKQKIIEFDQMLKPDVIVYTTLSMPTSTQLDYAQFYRRSKIEHKMIRDLPDISSSLAQQTKALVMTNRGLFSKRKSDVCNKANFLYYWFDGTTAYCGERHTIQCDDPQEMMKQNCRLLKKNIVPDGCKGCQYLPYKFFNKQWIETK
jgi:sulfatase maturation enzyme AslB (radical SAM superfamily)